MCVQNVELRAMLAKIENTITKSEESEKNNKSVAYQMADMGATLRNLGDQLILMARVVNGGPLDPRNKPEDITLPAEAMQPGRKWTEEQKEANRLRREQRRALAEEAARKEEARRKRSESIKSSWTPERRAAQAERMKGVNLHKLHAQL